MLQTQTLIAVMLLSVCSWAAPGEYVALGDDYASGVGAGNYDGDSDSCKRSTISYPALWVKANSPTTFSFTACSGATTQDVIQKQLGPLSPSTTLVSLTAGANNAEFVETVTTCSQQGERACLARIDQARKYIANTLPSKLDGLYDAITAKAPTAWVVVLGYPKLYFLGGTCAGGVSETAREAVNDLIDHLNSVIAKRAVDHGLVFGDVRNKFVGHELCSSDPWLVSVRSPAGEGYYPTATGYSDGYLPIFTKAV